MLAQGRQVEALGAYRKAILGAEGQLEVRQKIAELETRLGIESVEPSDGDGVNLPEETTP